MSAPTTGTAGRTLTAWVKSQHRQWLLLALDGLCIGLSLLAAYQIRFDGRVPPFYAAQLDHLLPVLLLQSASPSTSHSAFTAGRFGFRVFPEAVRLVAAGLVGSACFVAVPLLRHETNVRARCW